MGARAGVSRSRCGCRGAVLEQDQEPGWLAGKEAVSIPGREQGLGTASVVRLCFFPPLGQLIPSIFNELPQVAQ